ncbi:hypothetical protein [Streptomyces sp. NPDC003015]
MRYFGSKRELFSQAVQALPAPLTATDADELVDRLLASLDLRLGGLPEGTPAIVRSMLTDQAAADHARAVLPGAADLPPASRPGRAS